MNDPGARNIASRYDLRNSTETPGHDPSAFGCTDSKTTNLELAKNLQWHYRVGPVSGGNSNLPVYNYTENIEKYGPTPLGYWEVFPSIY